METTLIAIDSDAELARARALVDRLMASEKPADLARLAAQARLISAYEEQKWPPRPLSAAGVIRYLLDQHGLKQADLVPLLGNRRSEAADIGDGAALARALWRAGRPVGAAGFGATAEAPDKRSGGIGIIQRPARERRAVGRASYGNRCGARPRRCRTGERRPRPRRGSRGN